MFKKIKPNTYISSLYYDKIAKHSRICFSVFHAHYSENVKGRNQLVMENLRDQEYKVRNEKIYVLRV